MPPSGDDWVKSRSLEQLQEQFGKGIGQLLHNGDVALKDVLKNGGLMPMTLKDIQAKNIAQLSGELKYVPPLPTDSLSKIRYDIITKGQEKGLEYAAVLDGNGKLLAMVEGEKDKVSLKHVLENNPNAKSVLHNHPSGASLSLDDLYVSVLYDVEITALATYSKGEYRAKVLTDFAEFERRYPESKRRAKKFLQHNYGAGKISVADGDILFLHLINYLLSKDGLIGYNVVTFPPSLTQVLGKVDLSGL